MRRIFTNKYNVGYDQGYNKGYDDGFESGSKKAISVARKVFIQNIQTEIKKLPVESEQAKALEKAIRIIRKGY